MNPAYRILHLQRVTSATESPDYTKKGAGQHTIPVVRRLKYSVKSGAPSSHKKQRARYTSLFIHDMYFLFPYVGIIQIRFQVKTNQVYSQPIYLSSLFEKYYTEVSGDLQEISTSCKFFRNTCCKQILITEIFPILTTRSESCVYLILFNS